MDPSQAEAAAEALADQAAADRAAADAAAIAALGDGSGQPSVVGEGAQLSDAEPVQIVLVWQGIGALHKSFFSDADATTALSVGLAGTVQAPANIYVRHDNTEFIGSVRLQLRPDTLRLPIKRDGDVIDLSGLAPVTRALAAYRSDISGRFDVRVQSFSVGIESFRGANSCIFGVAGKPPPDGSILSPCVVVNGVQTCGQPQPAGVRFQPDAARAIASCLDL